MRRYLCYIGLYFKLIFALAAEHLKDLFFSEYLFYSFLFLMIFFHLRILYDTKLIQFFLVVFVRYMFFVFRSWGVFEMLPLLSILSIGFQVIKCLPVVVNLLFFIIFQWDCTCVSIFKPETEHGIERNKPFFVPFHVPLPVLETGNGWVPISQAKMWSNTATYQLLLSFAE